MQQKKDRSKSKYTTSVNTEDDATEFLLHSHQPEFCSPPLQYTIYQELSSHHGLTFHFDAWSCVTEKLICMKPLIRVGVRLV